MDVPRKVSKTKKYIWRVILTIIVIGSVIGTTVALSKLEPAAPSVDRSSVWTGTVERGDMVRKVRGSGSLVPVDVRFISPETGGRVERLLIEPGEPVKPGTVLMELSNAELQLALQDARLSLKSAEAQLAAQKVQLENELLDLESAAAKVEASYEEAKLKVESETELFNEGLISELQLKVTQVHANELAKLKTIEAKRVKVKREHAATQLDVLQAKIEQAKALVALKEEQVKSLQVKAGTAGVLEQRLVEIGHQVTPSTILAKVSDPAKLKAELQIDQNQAREVKSGQRVELDIRSNILKGQVARIDPAVQEGSVLVDVTVLDPLPAGARPDMSLFGKIEIEKLENILYVDRPVFSEPHAGSSLFQLSGDGTTARRVAVKFGAGSVNTIQVVSGLGVGDTIILSDMNAWNDVEKVQLD